MPIHYNPSYFNAQIYPEDPNPWLAGCLCECMEIIEKQINSHHVLETVQILFSQLKDDCFDEASCTLKAMSDCPSFDFIPRGILPLFAEACEQEVACRVQPRISVSRDGSFHRGYATGKDSEKGVPHAMVRCS